MLYAIKIFLKTLNGIYIHIVSMMETLVSGPNYGSSEYIFFIYTEIFLQLNKQSKHNSLDRQ